MKKIYRFFLFVAIFAAMLVPFSKAHAVSDPFVRPNNFVGIHILFPSELDQAENLVNSSGGQWGYVTIPIQIGDRDLDKWQEFMDKAKKLHVIPIIRLATQPDPRNTSVWRKPYPSDILDFANFLDSLNWPTDNRYVILFNEVNRFDEWGGEYPSPVEYADIVSYAWDVFKERDSRFYLILSGMDAAAPNDYKQYISGMTYLKDLVDDSDVVKKIDGFSSHSYPNPDFSAYPSATKQIGVATYRFEYDLLNKNSPKKLPVFITETGWSDKSLPQRVVSQYYDMTFSEIWDHDRDKIVAITPFLLNSVGGPFDHFSFTLNGQPKEYYKTFLSLSKIKGSPKLEQVKGLIASSSQKVLASETFRNIPQPKKLAISPFVSLYFKTIFGLN